MRRRFTMCFLLGLTVSTLRLDTQSSQGAMSPSAAVGLGSISGKSLPDAPGAAQNGSASVSGTVVDSSGAVVAGAVVSLMENGESHVATVPSGNDGSFTFSSLSPGFYFIAAKAKGFRQTSSSRFTLQADQAYRISSIVLSVEATATEIVVRPTEMVAAEQMKAAEKQRVFGIIPDFYTSYVWDAAPLNTKQKYSMALRDTFDPMTFVGVSMGAGIEQAKDAFPGYGQGAAGYGKRWGALFVNGRTSDILSRAVFPSLFHQDPRYFYQGSGSTWSRAKHAVGYAFVARSDSGHLMPNYSYFLGDIGSGAISNLYYPASSRGAGLVFTNAAIGIGGRAGQDLIREFLFKHLTKNVPGRAKSAPGSENP